MQEKTSTPTVKLQKLRSQFPFPEGNGSIIYTATVPSIAGHPKINDFYEKTAKICKKYCEKKLLIHCAKQSAEEPYREYSYKVSFKPTLSDQSIEMTVSASLYDRAARRTVSTHTEKHFWSLENDMMAHKPRKKPKTQKV